MPNTLEKPLTFADLGYFTVVARRQTTHTPSWHALQTALADTIRTASDLISGHGFFKVFGTPVAEDANDCNAMWLAFATQDSMQEFLLRPAPFSMRAITMEYRLIGSAIFLQPAELEQQHVGIGLELDRGAGPGVAIC